MYLPRIHRRVRRRRPQRFDRLHPGTPPIEASVAIALGTNVGDRRAHLAFAVDRLRAWLTDVTVSTWHETDPVGVGPQRPFLNGAAIGTTTLTARELLDVLLQIERDRGRDRPFPGAPRTLDLDLILYGREVIDEPGLRVPHPRFRDRAFVLGPLAEIAPDWIDPGTGRSIRALRSELIQTKRAER